MDWTASIDARASRAMTERKMSNLLAALADSRAIGRWNPGIDRFGLTMTVESQTCEEAERAARDIIWGTMPDVDVEAVEISAHPR